MIRSGVKWVGTGRIVGGNWEEGNRPVKKTGVKLEGVGEPGVSLRGDSSREP